MTARQASTSLPSTRTPGKPKPDARWYSGTRLCVVTGSLIAHWLFWQKKTTGRFPAAANTNDSLTSPWLDAPSPKKTRTAVSRFGSPVPTAPSRTTPIA